MSDTQADIRSLKGQLNTLSMSEFFASSPDVGEGVAGLRIARDSEYGILAVYKSTDTYNFDDGTGTACLLIDVDGNVILTDAALILNGTLGYIALGNPAPVHTGVGTWTGTGIGIDQAGIVGLAASVTQANFDATTGRITAGAGAVALSVSGITFDVSGVNGTKLKWFSAANNYNHGLIWVVESSQNADMEIQSLGKLATSNAVINMVATLNGVVGASLYLSANGTTSENYFGINAPTGVVIANSVGGLTAPSSTLHLKNTAPTFRMEDTTASAKDLLVTVDANLAKFQEAAGTDILTLDLANARVGIGNAAPANPLDVTGIISSSSYLRLGGVTAGKATMKVITALANNGVAQVSDGAADIGMVFILDAAGGSAIFSLQGGAHATTKQSAGGGYSVTAGTAGTNVYWSAGNSRYEIENKSGVTLTYNVFEFLAG